ALAYLVGGDLHVMLGRGGVPVDLDERSLAAGLVQIGVVSEQVGLVRVDELLVLAAQLPELAELARVDLVRGDEDERCGHISFLPPWPACGWMIGDGSGAAAVE